MKSVVNKILLITVQVADFLSRRMFLIKNVLVFGWMGMGKAAREAGLIAVAWVP